MRIDFRLGCAVVALTILPGLLSAKYVNNTPDVASPNYWDAYEIALVEVLNAPVNGDVTVKIIEQYSGKEWVPPVILAMKEYWLAPEGRVPNVKVGYDPGWKVGQRFLVVRPIPDLDIGGAAAILISDADKSPMVSACRAISRIRTEPNIGQALVKAIATADPLVEKYVLTKIHGLAKLSDASEVLKQLENLRSDSTATLPIRLLTSQVLNQFRGEGHESDDWQWASSLFSAKADYTKDQWKLVVNHLVLFSEKRSENAALFEKIADDPNVDIAKRAAAIEGFATRGLYDLKAADDKVLKSAANLLFRYIENKDSNLKEAAAVGLWRSIEAQQTIDERLSEPHLALAQRASKAIGQAIAAESSASTRNLLDYCKNRIDDMISKQK